MGEAKKKAAALALWQNTLSPEERIVYAVSRATYERIVRNLGAVGVCYRMTFFLTEYLTQEHGVVVEPVVGFVNDGETDVMASHGWIEFNGKKTDLSLTLTEHPDVQPAGPLLILDRAFTSGQAAYTYHRQRSAAAVRAMEMLSKDPAYRVAVLRKEAEHEKMNAVAASPDSIRAYLDNAPDGLTYESLARRVRSIDDAGGKS